MIAGTDACTAEWIVGHPSIGQAVSWRRLDSDLVVHCQSDSLRTAGLTLGGLGRDMAKQKLNLLQFSSGHPT